MKKAVIIIIMFNWSIGVYAQFAGGDGSPGSPYQVTNAAQLNSVRDNMSSHFIQTADIDLNVAPYNTGSGWAPIGNSSTVFTGYYDGGGHTISNLFVYLDDGYAGLFGRISGATITKLGVINADVSGQYNVGGLAGAILGNSTISLCYSTGQISVIDGGYDGGGLVGYCTNTSTISNCYSHASVIEAESTVGGLLGELWSGTVLNCYSTGSIYAETPDNEGGLIGSCYGTVTDCFWDTQTSGNTSSENGTGKTTAEMKTLATFTDQTTAGLTTAWDFETNPNDDVADDDYWDMDLSGTINNGYPYLYWQDGGDVSLPVELAYFNAVVENNAVSLQWRSESETDNLGYIIERKSVSLESWITIAAYNMNRELQGKGNSTSATFYTWTDNTCKPGETYQYRLADVNSRGIVNILATVEITFSSHGLPDKTSLLPAYPNPFNPETRISYSLANDANVNLTVVDLLGRVIAHIIRDKAQTAGEYAVSWSGRDDNGLACPAGMYMVVLKTGNYTAAQKVMLVK